jgi:peptidoglycan/xylan/chitin deacetylase (PgdA/CDA1 family)
MGIVRLAGIIALTVTLTVLGIAPTRTAPASARPPVATPLSAPPLFRIVGCRSDGQQHSQGPSVREVAIGFDDGPWQDTPQFVAMLEQLHVNATFFMIGEQISSGYRSVLLRELHAGDVLGDHTWTHPDLVTYGHVRWELGSDQARIRELTGYTPCLFRPPYGAIDSNVVGVARSLGMATILWDVDPVDWSTPGTSKIISRVLAQVQPGSIILSHDGGGYRGETLAAYRTIIPALRARGYRIVTIPQLLGFRPIYHSCTGAGCDGLGIPGDQLPADAIVRGGPIAMIARR